VTKLAVLYYSSTGTVDQMARRIAATAEKQGAEVRLRHVAETAPDEAIAANEQWQEHVDAQSDEPIATPDDLVWADAVLLGSPTRFGHVSSQLQAFLDTLGPQWQEGKLADKVYAGFTAAATEHGGQETTLLALYTTIHHFGGIIVAPGYTDEVKFQDGNPYGVSAAADDDGDGLPETQLQALDHLTERVLNVAGALAG